MKLLRYGPAGAEKPAMLDADGAIRCLSGVLRDVDAFALSPVSLKMLAGIDPSSLPRVEGNPRIGPCVVRPTNYVCIGLNYADHAAETGCRGAEGADRVPQVSRRVFRTERRRAAAARVEEAGLGSGTWDRDRNDRSLRERGGRIGLRRRLLRLQRRVRAGVPGGARRHLGQGQGRRYVRADRSLDGDEG